MSRVWTREGLDRERERLDRAWDRHWNRDIPMLFVAVAIFMAAVALVPLVLGVFSGGSP